MKTSPSPTVQKNQASDWIREEQDTKANGGISIEIRSKQKGWDSDLYYLEMGCLAAEVDIHNGIDRGAPNSFNAYGKQFKPLRNALMHTSLLTAEAKGMLRSVRDNIKGKIVELLKPKP